MINLPTVRTRLASQHYNVWVKVEASKPGPPTPSFDLTDRFVRARINATIDDPSRQFEMVFHRGSGTSSLSPYVAGSSFNVTTPLLYGGTLVFLQIAIVNPGVTPVPADYFYLEVGRIDSWDPAAEDGKFVKVSGRDYLSAFHLNALVRNAKKFGLAGGKPVELVIQDIIAEGFPFGNGLTVIGTPNWNVREFPQEPGPILPAYRKLALQIAWDVRTFPRSFLTSFDSAPVFYDPAALLTTVATIGPAEYKNVHEMPADDNDVRNDIDVWYGNRTTRQRANAIDAASQARHGVRYLRLSEDSTSNIDTALEAQRMADAVRDQLNTPIASHRITLPFWPLVELNDRHTYPANPVYYDTDLNLNILQYSHEIAQGGGTTTMYARGKPLAAYRTYRRGEPRLIHVSEQDPPLGTEAREHALWCNVGPGNLAFPP